MVRRLFNSKHREQLWLREKNKAYLAGLGAQPRCNLCSLPVLETDDWDESHDPGKAKAFGGKKTGVAHRPCNQRHNNAVVTPAVAKAKRVYRKHIGAQKPGMGRFAMRGGRRSGERKTIAGQVVRRTTGAERHAAMLASRALRDADGNPVGVWAETKP